MTDDPRIGREFAGYRIEALIGRGGMGVVYRAEHLRLGRKVALKLLTPELAENEGFRVRFERESRLAAAIDHPNIIPLYEAGDDDGLLFITMRYVDGTDLKALLAREGPFDLERTLAFVGQIGGALDAAHGRGLVHRDVKPANVLVASGGGGDSSDHCYLTDFGLTKDTSSNVELTATGQFVGTIAYVAPEQIQGTEQGGGADLYALGCVLYECLTGHTPFERKNEVEVMWAHLADDPPALSERRPDLPPELDAVVATALAKAPEERYTACADLVSAVRALVPGSGPVATPQTAAPAFGAGGTRLSARPAETAAPVPPPQEATRPAPDAPAPRPASGRRSRIVALVAAAAVVVAGAAIGVVAAGTGDEGEPVAGNVAAAGSLSVRFPADWGTVPSPPDIAGLELRDRIAIAPRSTRGRAGLLAGRLPKQGVRLLPRDLRAESAGASAPDLVALGETEALRYATLRPPGFSGAITLYLVITDEGPAALACYAATPSAGFAADCGRVAASLEVAGGAAKLAPSDQYAKALGALLTDAAATRKDLRRRLDAAGTSVSQARAASALARSCRARQRRVRSLPAPAAADAANASIASSIADAGDGYSAMAAAARDRDSAAYGRAQGAVRAAERALRRAVGALAELGYTVGS